MTERLTDAELDVLCEDSMGWPEIPVIVSELRELRQQNVALRADVARAQWRAAMAQIDVGQKLLEQLAAADALADTVEMAETSIQWYAWPDLEAALLAYRERRARNAV